MAPEELTIFDAQLAALDRATACRVARLVIECGASIPLALQAVADAKTQPAAGAAPQRPAAPRWRLAQICSFAAMRH